MTLHKAQGISLDAAAVRVGDTFEPGMCYATLSRVRTALGVHIVGGIANVL